MEFFLTLTSPSCAARLQMGPADFGLDQSRAQVELKPPRGHQHRRPRGTPKLSTNGFASDSFHCPWPAIKRSDQGRKIEFQLVPCSTLWSVASTTVQTTILISVFVWQCLKKRTTERLIMCVRWSPLAPASYTHTKARTGIVISWSQFELESSLLVETSRRRLLVAAARRLELQLALPEERGQNCAIWPHAPDRCPVSANLVSHKQLMSTGGDGCQS